MALSNLTKVQTVGIGSNIEVVGVITTGQFKTGTSNLHSSGVELTNLNVSGIATIGGNVSIGGTLTYQDVTNIDSVGLITARNGINVIGHSELDNVSISGVTTVTGSIIDNSGTYLHLKTNAGEDMAKFQKDGGSFLYFNNQLRLETKLNGIDVTGRVTAGNGFYGDGSNLTGVTQVGGASSVTFNDSVAANFGTDRDLEIYHIGTNAVISNTTGNLHIKDNSIKLQDESANPMILATGGQGVQLYYNASQKFSTTANGVQVNANSSTDGLLVTASQEGTVTVADQRDASYKASFLMGGSAPTIRNQNTNTGDRTLSLKKGTTTVAYWDGNGHYLPGANDTYDMGSTSLRWRNIYTNDLNLSN